MLVTARTTAALASATIVKRIRSWVVGVVSKYVDDLRPQRPLEDVLGAAAEDDGLQDGLRHDQLKTLEKDIVS